MFVLFVLTDKRQHVWKYRNRERRTAKTVTPGTKEAFKVKWLRINGLNQLNFKKSILPHWKKGCVVRRSNKKIALSLVKLFRGESHPAHETYFPVCIHFFTTTYYYRRVQAMHLTTKALHI